MRDVVIMCGGRGHFCEVISVRGVVILVRGVVTVFREQVVFIPPFLPSWVLRALH